MHQLGNSKYVEPPKDESNTHKARLYASAASVKRLEREIAHLISDIEGPKPMLDNPVAGKAGMPTLLNALCEVPDEIGSACERMTKDINYLRGLLRV